MTISEVYHELIEEGKTKNKAAEICEKYVFAD